MDLRELAEYGIEFHIVTLIERFTLRASADRVGVRMTAA